MIMALRVIVFAGLIGLLGLSIVGSLGFAVWQGEMIAPFRLQLLIASVVALGVSLSFKDKYLIFLAVGVIASNALPMAIRLAERKLLPVPSASTNPARHISLVVSNVLCDNTHYGRVTDMVKAEQPDVFVAVETTPEWIEHLAVLKTDYPYVYAPPKLGLLGITVYARKPFKADLIAVGPRKAPLVRLEFSDYVLFAAHPMPPARKRLTEDNRVYITELARLVTASTKPVILAGDLNATLWSHNIEPLLKTKMQWPRGSGLAYSWPAGHPQMAIQIDHVLTKGARAGTYRILPGVGSDHFPVRAEIDM